MPGYLPADGSDDQIRYNNGFFGCDGGHTEQNFRLCHRGSPYGGSVHREYSRVLKDNTYVRNPDGTGLDY